MMTPLCKRIVDAIVLCGSAARTHETCFSAAGKMVRHHDRSPDLLIEVQVHAYLLKGKTAISHYRISPRASCASWSTTFSA